MLVGNGVAVDLNRRTISSLLPFPFLVNNVSMVVNSLRCGIKILLTKMGYCSNTK